MASKEFSNKLKNLRLKAGYSQKDVYEHFSIPQSTFSSWEVGKSEPSGEMLLKLCEFYKCDMMKEFSSEDNLTYKEWEIIEKYRILDASGKSHIDVVLKWETERMKQLTQASSAPAAKPPLRLIQYYQRLASAGTGQYVFDSIPTEQIEIPDIPEYRKVQFALGVNGLSMEPLYSHGDILLIEPTQEIQPGEIGIFLHNGESFVKELGDGVLHSLNDLYDDIELTEDTRCVGRVIDKLDAPISVSEELGKKLRALAKKAAEKHA